MIQIKLLKKILKIILIVSTVLFPMFLNLFGGIGLIYESVRNYSSGTLVNADYMHFKNLGICMLISSFLIICATVLCFKKKDLISMILETAGFIMCMAVLVSLAGTASQNGLSDENLKPYREIYFQRHFPTIIHFIVVFVLSLMDYFSYDNILQRKFKKNKEDADDSIV